jgi:glutathione peroxidase
MSPRQKILYFFYPLLKWIGSLQGQPIKNPGKKPGTDIYSIGLDMADGGSLPLSGFRGRKLLFVNTASGCGYTRQLESLKILQQRFPELAIILFPSNDFKDQEPLSNKEILNFCRVNYGTTFPVAAKSRVTKGGNQNKIFEWLTDAQHNGWNNQSPEWNFTKYLVNEEGSLVAVAGASIDPLLRKFLRLLE